uniref:Uncharacterized protein n=1 Tax=Molossus molossus TaxID=27622 RepID=A0A7J8JVN5_MOLMO|nr:hypothetical protein HJG59_007951 [Molossus molossus]
MHHRAAAVVVCWSAFQAEKQSWSPVTPWPPKLTFLHPWCWVVEHSICKPKNWCYRIVFSPEQSVHSVTGLRVREQEVPFRGQRSPLQRGQNNKEAGQFPSPAPPPFITTTPMIASGCRGQHWDSKELKVLLFSCIY